MTLIALADVLAGVKTTMAGVSGAYIQGYSDLTESIADHPLIQVWPGGGGMSDPSTNTSTQTSFRGGLSQLEHTVFVDLYATQRAFIGQDMNTLVSYIDKIMVILDGQRGSSNAFGVGGARLFHWNWDYFQEAYAGDQQVGARFALTIRTY